MRYIAKEVEETKFINLLFLMLMFLNKQNKDIEQIKHIMFFISHKAMLKQMLEVAINTKEIINIGIDNLLLKILFGYNRMYEAIIYKKINQLMFVNIIVLKIYSTTT